MASLFRRHARGRPPHPDVLTPAEWQVLEQLRGERSNAEIAAALGVSVNTVRTHVSSMLAKLALPDRTALAAWSGQPAEIISATRHDTLPQARSRLSGLATWVGWGAKGAAVVTTGALFIVAMRGINTGSEAGVEDAGSTPASATVPAEPTASPTPLTEFSLTPQLIGGIPYSVRATLDFTGKTALDLNMENRSYGPDETVGYAPTFIQGTPGQTMTLVLRNAATAMHNFTLPDQQITQDVAPGSIAIVDVTIPRAGGLLFYCRFHTGAGMNGQLLAGVIPPQALAIPTALLTPTAAR